MIPISEDLQAEQWKRGDSLRMRAFDLLSKCVHDCVAAGKFGQVDPEIVNQIFWAGIHGVVSFLIMHSEGLPPKEAERLIHSMVQILVAGLSNLRPCRRQKF